MKLPYFKNAYISKEKLINYLLSESHPVGSSKAKFFRSLGFNETNIDALTKSLLMIINTNYVKEIKKSIYGINYVVDGELKTPSKEAVMITTVWFIKKGENEPRFVTAYPV